MRLCAASLRCTAQHSQPRSRGTIALSHLSTLSSPCCFRGCRSLWQTLGRHADLFKLWLAPCAALLATFLPRISTLLHAATLPQHGPLTFSRPPQQGFWEGPQKTALLLSHSVPVQRESSHSQNQDFRFSFHGVTALLPSIKGSPMSVVQSPTPFYFF